MPNPGALVDGAVGLIDKAAPAIAIGVGLYWGYMLLLRSRNSDDPSVRKFGSSGIGSWSFLVSGAYASMLLAGIIAVVTWPLAIETPAVGVVLALGVGFHAVLEMQEKRGAGA